MVKGKCLFIQKYDPPFTDNANAPLDFNLFSFVERALLILG